MKNVFKNKKFLLFYWSLFFVVAIFFGCLVGGAPKRENNSFKKTIQKVLTPIAKEYGIENLEVLFVEDGYKEKIVLTCDNMSTISYEDKANFLDKAAAAMEKKGSKYDFYETDNLAIYSDGHRYTATADTLTSDIYQDGNRIDSSTGVLEESGAGQMVSPGESIGQAEDEAPEIQEPGGESTDLTIIEIDGN